MARICKAAPAWESDVVLPNMQIVKQSSSDYKKWVVLFFYPLDFTFVCPTEIIEFSNKADEFKKVNCDVLGCSVDSQFTVINIHFMHANINFFEKSVNFKLQINSI